MTIDSRIERALPGILAELGAGPTPDYAEEILARTSRAHQRPTWVFPGRWLAVGAALRRVPAWALPSRRWANVAVALLLVLALVAAAVYVGSHWKRLPLPFGPASNGVVAYASMGDIYAFDPVTRTSRAIVTGPTYDHSPFFSPNGTKLAYLRGHGAGITLTEIVVADFDGSDPMVITPSPLPEMPWEVQWTPNSASIALITHPRGDGVLEIFDASRAAEPRVIDAHMKIDSFVFQPPDGRRILFRGQVGEDIRLYGMNADGSAITPVRAAQGSGYVQYYDVSWWGDSSVPSDKLGGVFSPDGTKIVDAQWQVDDGVFSLRLHMMNADGSDDVVIGHSPGDLADAYPVFSPDGTRIAFARLRAETNSWRYAVLRLEDGKVTETGPEIPDGRMAMTWSPDSTQILAIEHSYEQLIMVLDPDGGSFRELGAAESQDWWWTNALLNGFDAGSWQRKASP
jgi:Tol biopolymer transport system component